MSLRIAASPEPFHFFRYPALSDNAPPSGGLHLRHVHQADGPEHARMVYKMADRRLGGQEWAVGRFSIADIHLFRLFWRFRGWLNPDFDEFPYLSAHYERMMARPAVMKTIEIEAAIGYQLPA